MGGVLTQTGGDPIDLVRLESERIQRIRLVTWSATRSITPKRGYTLIYNSISVPNDDVIQD